MVPHLKPEINCKNTDQNINNAHKTHELQRGIHLILILISHRHDKDKISDQDHAYNHSNAQEIFTLHHSTVL